MSLLLLQIVSLAYNLNVINANIGSTYGRKTLRLGFMAPAYSSPIRTYGVHHTAGSVAEALDNFKQETHNLNGYNIRLVSFVAYFIQKQMHVLNLFSL